MGSLSSFDGLMKSMKARRMVCFRHQATNSIAHKNIDTIGELGNKNDRKFWKSDGRA